MLSAIAAIEPDLTEGTGTEAKDVPNLAAGALLLSTATAALNSEFLERSKRLAKQNGELTAQRLALLGIVLAALPGVEFADTCVLARASKPERLERMIHGEEQMTTRVAEQLEAVYRMLANLHRVLKPEATSQWLHTEIPTLGSMTPIDLIDRGRLDEVVRLTQSYLDPSFG